MGGKRLTQEEDDRRALNLGLRALGSLVNSAVKRLYECIVCNKQVWKKPNSIQVGKGCPSCGNKRKGGYTKIDIEIVKLQIQERGYILNSHFYKNNQLWINISCPQSHDAYDMRWNSFRKGSGCFICGNARKNQINKCSIEEVRIKGLEKGFYLNSENYNNSKEKLDWSCKAEWHFFKSRWNDIDQGHGCPICKKSKRGFENYIYNAVLNSFPSAQQNVVGLLKSPRLELDVYIPGVGAIECDGDNWHSYKENIERDARKNRECNELGIKLLRIKYSEYKKNSINVIEKAISFLGGVPLSR